MELRYKIWLEKDGEPLLSFGKYLLLKEIEKTGSIYRAAQNLNIPYKKAHSYIKLTEKRFGKKLFTRKRGKGTVLTEEGKKLLELYEEILKRFENTAKGLKELLREPP